jgi:hypothetical protein
VSGCAAAQADGDTVTSTTEGSHAVLIFYIDESGHHSMETDPSDSSRLARGTSEWFVLSAVGVDVE